MEAVTTAILVILVLAAVGIVSSQLMRLRDWLNKAPPPDQQPPDQEN